MFLKESEISLESKLRQHPLANELQDLQLASREGQPVQSRIQQLEFEMISGVFGQADIICTTW